MNIRFKNVHSFRYKATAFVLSLAVLVSGLVWYGVARSNDQKAEAVYPSRSIVYVDTDFYDYYNDAKVLSNSTTNAQGNLKRPFQYFNEAVSNYAVDGRNWRYPLYLGQFWVDTGGGPENENMYKQETARNQTSYNNTPKDQGDNGDKGSTLNNFVWAANLAFRPNTSQSTDLGYTGGTPQFYAATQGLVDGSGNDSSGNLVPACGGVNLPYFDEDFLNANYYIKGSYRKIAKVYDNKSYPFYATDESVKIGTDYTDDGMVMDKFGPGYRFDSDVSGLYFDSSENLVATTNTITDVDGKLGFFPFNQTKSNDASLNYCFGAKYTINFSMNENGTVDGEAWSSEHGTSDDNRAYFTFRGDDDVWVFIDDQLVLDMGGDHKKAEGYIDFTNKKSGVLFSANIAEHVGSSSNLRVASSAVKRSEKDLTSIFEDLNLADGNQHKLTMFYMERGMLNSNLFVQFNMPTTPHEDILTITDKVSVDKVNKGLQSQTLAVADSDVVNYTVSNKGTEADDVSITGLEYPTYDYVRRRNTEYQDQYALLSGKDAESERVEKQVLDSDYIYLVAGGEWTQYGGTPYAWVGQGTSFNDRVVKFQYVSGNLYRIPNYQYKVVQFIRYNGTISNLGTYPTGSNVWACIKYGGDDGETWDSSKYNLMTINGTGYGGWTHTWSTRNKTVTEYVEKKDTQDKKFLDVTKPDSANPGYNFVAQTNYELIDPKAQIRRGSTWRGFGTSSIANQTDSNGTISMMYGQSAVFTGQFKPSSTMHIVQDNKLYNPDPRITDSQALSNSNVVKFANQNGDRTISHYYNVSEPTLLYKNDPDGSNTGSPKRDTSSNTDEFTFANQKNTTDKVNIEAIYTREVKTGSISIKKELSPAQSDWLPGSDDEFTMKVEMSSLFGTTSTLSKVNNYGEIDITKSSTKSSTGYSTSTKLDSDGTFKMKAGETVTIDGIPVGTKVTIKETETGANWANVTITGGGVINIKEGTNGTVTVTNERKTGTLTLQKKLAYAPGAEAEQSDNTTKFTFEVTLTSSESSIKWNELGDKLQKSNDGWTLSHNSTSVILTNYEITAGDGAVEIKGIPYGVTYTVEETSIPTGWEYTETEIAEGSATKEATSDVFDHDVETVTVTNKKKVATGTLTIKKELDYSLGAKEEPNDNTTKFTFEVTLTSSESGINWKELGYELQNSNDGWTMRYKDEPDGFVELTNVNITAGDAEPAKIKGIPYGVTYTVEEIDVPDKWQYYSTKITEDGVSGEQTANSGTLDHEKENVVVTNRKKVAYLTIEKYIDELYYGKKDTGECDNPHGFADGSRGVTSPLNDYDPFGYLNYTSAEQDFVFKIEKYNLDTDLNASPKPKPISTSYVVLKFDKDSLRKDAGYNPGSGTSSLVESGDYKYKQSTTVKVEPGYTYKVSEVTTGISWRYELTDWGIEARQSSGGYALEFNGSSKFVAVVYGLKADFSGIPVARFFNKRTTDSQTVESDMSSIKNKLTIT